MKLLVFSSSRRIRAYHEEALKVNSLLDKAMSIKDFLDKILISPKRKASEYESLLFMQKACLDTENIHKLHINENFFAFLKNKEYLFSFFKELALEKVAIKELQNSDYYAEYEEHLQVLDSVFKNYLLLLAKAGLSDDISLILEHSLNLAFLQNYESIIFDLQGFLSQFEAGLLSSISKHKELILHFSISEFNLASLQKLEFLKELELKIGHKYEYNLSLNLLIKEEVAFKNKPQIYFKSFDLASLQASFVFDSVSKMLRAGLEPKDIVVITADESFSELLRLYDTENMLNYAAGKSLKYTFFYQKLKALTKAASDEAFIYNENEAYFDDEKTSFDKYNTLLHIFKLDFKAFQVEFERKRANWAYFEGLITHLLDTDEGVENEKNELFALIKNELLFLERLCKNHSLSLKELLELFFMKLERLSLSLVGGGEVGVMGLLESRGLEFKGVIIVDFNDELIPKRSVNELFLNNEVRFRAGLITYTQRENLQRFYYESLIKKAQYVYISCVENEQRLRSRLLDELAFEFTELHIHSNKAYARALRPIQKPSFIDLEPLKAPKLKHDIFASPLSFSKMHCFLNAKRTYYYRYILGLKEARQLQSELKAASYGTILHEILNKLYQNNKTYFDEKLFIHLLENSPLNRLKKAVLKLQFKAFGENENKRFKEGFRVKELEDKNKAILKSYELNACKIQLKGFIDRVDEDKNGNLLIIDYKSGTLPTNSYQLAFYQALYDKDASVAYYDLKNMKLECPKNTKSLSQLEEQLLELYKQKDEEIEFINESKFCPFASIYEKDLK